MEWNAAIGAAIRHFRKASGAVQAVVAQAAEVEQGSVSKIENGKQGLSFDSLGQVAKALKVRPSEIVAFAEDLKGVGASLPKSRPDKPADLPQLVNRLEGDIDQLRTLIFHGMRTVISRLPGAAAEMETALLADTDSYYAERGGQAAYLALLREVREAEEAERPAAQPRAKGGKSR